VRAPTDSIAAPPFPAGLVWLNAPRAGIALGSAGAAGAPVSVIQRGRPMLVEFWDFCRPNSMRTLPYVKAWHERYARHGLRIIGVHSPGFEISRSERAVREAVARLAIEHMVAIDSDMLVWQEYENEGWPARYLFDGHARLFDYQIGEGGYEESELAIQELVGVSLEPLAPLRPEEAPGAVLAPQSADQEGAYCGSYAAGGVWAVLDGEGTVIVNGGSAAGGCELSVSHPGAYALIEHEYHTEAALDLALSGGVRCLMTCFTPGLARGPLGSVA